MDIKENKRNSPKRLLIDIPEDLHKEIKQQALNRNIPMRTWILRILITTINNEKKD